MRPSTIFWGIVWTLAFILGLSWGVQDARAHGLQCTHIPSNLHIHCATLNAQGCCQTAVLPPPPAPPFWLSGEGSHCMRARAAQRSTDNARDRCRPGTWAIVPAFTEFSGPRTPTCPIEPHDSSNFGSNGVFDIVTVYGWCQR